MACCGGDSCASNAHPITHIDFPHLILDLDSENDTHLKVWRNDPTVIVVQAEGSQSLAGGEDWSARSLVCFAD